MNLWTSTVQLIKSRPRYPVVSNISWLIPLNRWLFVGRRVLVNACILHWLVRSSDVSVERVVSESPHYSTVRCVHSSHWRSCPTRLDCVELLYVSSRFGIRYWLWIDLSEMTFNAIWSVSDAAWCLLASSTPFASLFRFIAIWFIFIRCAWARFRLERCDIEFIYLSVTLLHISLGAIK